MIKAREVEALVAAWIPESPRLTPNEDRPAVGAMDAADDANQRALACAVLPGEDVNFAGLQLEIHLPQHPVRAEGLGDPRHPQERRRRSRWGRSSHEGHATRRLDPAFEID